MADKITNDNFQQFFLEWCRSQRVNRGVQAAFSWALKSKGEVPLDLLKGALLENLKPSVFAARLQASGYDVALVWSLLQAAENENEVKVEKTKPQEADLKDGAEAKTEAEEVAPDSNKVVIVPSSVAAASKSKLVIQRADPAAETAAQSNMEGADFKAADSPESKADESASTGGLTDMSSTPTKILRPPAPATNAVKQKPEEYSFFDWFKNPRATWAKRKKNKEIKAANKASQKSEAKTPKPAAKPPVKKWVWWVVGIVALILLISGSYIATGNRISDMTSGLGGNAPEAPVVPDEDLTAMTPEEKEAWANTRLSSSVTETFLTKPTSFVDFFMNWKSYLNWMLYIAAALLVSFSIFRERTQAAEFSDIRQYMIGISSALILITFSNLIGNGAFNAGWTTSPAVFQYVALVVGFLINIFMQYSAYDSGNKDASVLAAGIYIFGLLLKWWFPLDAVLSTVGFALMVLGLLIQYWEIGRHSDRDAGAITKSLIASILMLVVFSAVYIWMYGLLESQIASFIIPADVSAQAGAAIKLNFLVKGQIATSALVALLLSYVFGLVYGSIFLPTRGRDGTVDIRSALVLDADASTLFVMFLFLFLPWIWVLPKVWLLVFG